MRERDQDIDRVLYDASVIQDRVQALGRAISADYEGRRPLVVGILSGSFVFMADLLRATPIPLDVDFISVSSYGSDTKSSGVVRLIKDLNQPIEGRHVLLVEDIVDTGLTLKYLFENLRTRRPASLEICALLEKPQARDEAFQVRYSGLECPDAFVVGYGLDYDGLYRNLPYIGVLAPKVYKS